MGTISVVWDPKSWLVFNQGMSSFLEGDLIYQMIIGEGENQNHLHYSFIENVSQENYEKILDGTYKVVSFPNSYLKALLFDENGKLISFIKGTEVDDMYLDEAQLEVINEMEDSSSMKLERNND